MMRWLYSCVMTLVQPVLRRKLARRGLLEPGYLLAIDERFGCYSGTTLAIAGKTIWIHAVSLGETRAAAALIAALRQLLPGMRLLLTHGTATGRSEGAKMLQAGDLQCWQPWDTPIAVQRFLEHFKPDIGILMETEIWPNLVNACGHRGVPLVLANARMSDKSMRQAQRLACLSRPAFGQLSAVWAQTQADAMRLTRLGAKVQGVFGNIKFDVALNASQIAKGQAWRGTSARPVVMLASSREGEELALLQILKAYWPPEHAEQAQAAIDSVVDKVTWLIVPRHPQRFDEVAVLAQSLGFTVSRRSGWDAELPVDGTWQTLWLGDSLGEMAQYYSLADVALLGGSFEPLGGQNLIEAAACGCPVVMGPHTFNFAEAAQLAEQTGAAKRVADLTVGVKTAATLALDAGAQLSMARRANEFAQANRGAVAKTAQAVLDLLGQQRVDGVQVS